MTGIITPFGKYAAFTLKLLVTIFLFWFLLGQVDTQILMAQLSSPDPIWIILAALSQILQNILVSWRWQRMLRHYGTQLRLSSSIRLTFEGAFFSQALPSIIGGDAIRIFRARKYGLDLGTAASSILLDRLVGLVGLLIIAVVGFPWIFKLDKDGIMSLGLFFLILAGFGLTALFLMLPLLPEAIRKLPIFSLLSNQGRRARAFLISPGSALPLMAMSVIGHFLTFACIYGLAVSMGFSVSWTAIMIATPAALLITMLPISIGGWGLREGALVAGLALFQVPAEASLALSISFGIMLILINIPGGIIWLAAHREETHK